MVWNNEKLSNFPVGSSWRRRAVLTAAAFLLLHCTWGCRKNKSACSGKEVYTGTGTFSCVFSLLFPFPKDSARYSLCHPSHCNILFSGAYNWYGETWLCCTECLTIETKAEGGLLATRGALSWEAARSSHCSHLMHHLPFMAAQSCSPCI